MWWRTAGPADAEAFGAIFCAAFELPDGAAPWAATLAGRPAGTAS
jgi:hypothetical protein